MSEGPTRQPPERPNIFPTEVALRHSKSEFREALRRLAQRLLDFFRLPLRAETQEGPTETSQPEASALNAGRSVRRTASRRLRVLVLDDDALAALDIADFVEAAGHEVSARCASRAQALNRIEAEPPDFAVLDVNLGFGETCEDVADRLVELAIPFAFVTGYRVQHASVLRRHHQAAALPKPVALDGLLHELNRAIEPGALH